MEHVRSIKNKANILSYGFTVLVILALSSCHSEISENSTANLPDPLEAGWNGERVCEVLKENEELRILKCIFPAGVGHEKHFHSPHVGYTFVGGKFRMIDSRGTREVNVPEGYVFGSDSISVHEVLNIGDNTAEFLIIEYK
ncbi:hypothetical protein [Marinoscillum sp.]|uniref:hypothetical protein n=1 Tax=Marinoscillum sp. TaxID=2024838 RepID=UPI003BA941AE